MKELTKEEQDYLKGYAQALQDILYRLTGDYKCAKSYDPIDFDENEIHSYAFNLKDGGRHHPLSDYKDIREIEEWMLKQTREDIEEEFELEDFHPDFKPNFKTKKATLKMMSRPLAPVILSPFNKSRNP